MCMYIKMVGSLYRTCTHRIHYMRILNKHLSILPVTATVTTTTAVVTETVTSSVGQSSVVTVERTFHKRQLPHTLVSLSSVKGKQYFKEALANNGMESFFSLSEQFVTQSEPSFCALSSLAMVLNALCYDPKKTWKGSWRWVSEETLQCESVQKCGHSLDKVRKSGMDFNEFRSLATCHSVPIQSYRVYDNNTYTNDDISSSSSSSISISNSPNISPRSRPSSSSELETNIDLFRSQVIETSSSNNADTFIVVNFSRKVLGQTGDGHFSPIGGYNRDRDLVLIMDVARFKYPPFWVPLQQLWQSMSVIDSGTKDSRGYFILSTNNSSNRSGSDDSNSGVTDVASDTTTTTTTMGQSHVHSSTCNHKHH